MYDRPFAKYILRNFFACELTKDTWYRNCSGGNSVDWVFQENQPSWHLLFDSHNPSYT